jgi:hypothetical protein
MRGSGRKPETCPDRAVLLLLRRRALLQLRTIRADGKAQIPAFAPPQPHA